MKELQELTGCVCEIAQQAGAYIREECASFNVEKVSCIRICSKALDNN